MVRRRWIVAAATGAAVAALLATRRGDEDDEVTEASWISQRYDRLAGVYDLVAAPYEWIDGRRLVRRGITELRLSPDDTVVALGVGTGWSLPLLAEQVGPTGRVVGVDLSEQMLERARTRVDDAGIGDRVDLVVADMREVELPSGTSGILAAFSVEMVADHDQLVEHLLGQVAPGTRIAFSGLRDPSGWPDWLVRIAVAVNRAFGVRQLHRELTPWQSLLDRVDDAHYVEDFGGAVYLAVGSAPDA